MYSIDCPRYSISARPIAVVVSSPGRRAVTGGGRRPPRKGSRLDQASRSKNLVVDTLNLVHWVRRDRPGPIVICDILATIDMVAPALRARFPGKIIFVTKERERTVDRREKSQIRGLYKAAAQRNGVNIDVVERLPKDDGRPSPAGAHAALGRDDFYLMMTAWKLKCGVLSRDRYRDLTDMQRGGLDPFHVYIYSPHRAAPSRDFVNPAAAELKRMRRPYVFDPEEVLPGL